MENIEGNSAVLEVSSENQIQVPTAALYRPKAMNVSSEVSNIISVSHPSSKTQSPTKILSATLEVKEGLNSRDLVVLVDNPQKHAASLDTFITFRVTTTTSREEFINSNYTVRRRYSDFVWLRQKLIDTFPTHIIPPLPAKHSLLAQLDRYSREFVLNRMTMLQRFLNRIVCHPVLSSHPTFHVFLTAKQAEFSVFTKQSVGMIKRMTGSIHQIATTYSYYKVDPEFKAVGEYVESLLEKLSTLGKVGDSICNERKAYVLEVKQLHPIFTSWAAIESEARPLLLDVGVALETIATAYQEHLISSHDAHFSQPLKEYLLYLESIYEALERRDAIQIDYENSLDELNKLKIEKEQVTNSNPSTTQQSFGYWKPISGQDKLEQLNISITKSLNVVEENHDKMEVANESFNADIERWQVEKKNDLKRLLVKMADHHISYYKQCLEAWEKVMPTLKVTGMKQNCAAGPSSASSR